ncbi:sodium-dependent neutral amino acid transporter B(0)AT2 isoform X1 [Hydra vulgaris]|uniref:Transporter n=1 Tax=Hydra vulgaris TaxID=6087 RepID=T2M528_HYDVU|nr:sodium-dependent neutral amino acid transporter B(0)AT2 [Hydra vulgaris]
MKEYKISVTDDINNVQNKSIVKERESWGNKIEFFLAILSYAVGLGNVWRFPYLVQKNGGGAFLIPYLLTLITMGIPIFFLELGVGQRLQKGPLHAWNHLSPYFAGIGLASVMVAFLVSSYYNMIIGWCFYYLFISFQKNVPYAKCPVTTDQFGNKTLVEECSKSSPTTYFWYRVVLNSSDSIEDSGIFNWKLCLCLLLAWVVVYLTSFKGTSSMGKTVYFTSLFPYVVLTAFFIRMVMLKGSYTGIKHMFTPKFEKLKNAEIWLDGASQIFYSLGLGFGGLISMSSYNHINNNIMRDTIMVSIIDCGTSIFAGTVIFGILGYKATFNYELCLKENLKHGTNRTCDLKVFLDQVAEGPGLTFIAFTEAMSTMSGTPFWSVLFFIMLLTLGIGTMIGSVEGVRTTLIDLKFISLRKELVHLILCSILFCLGLLFCQGSGIYWLQMFDTYSASVSLLVIALLESFIVVYVYGIKNFEDDIEFMLGKRPNFFWKFGWCVTAPLLIVSILIASLYGLFSKTITYNSWNSFQFRVEKKSYPSWGIAFSFFLLFISVVIVPLTMLFVKLGWFKIKKKVDWNNEDFDMSSNPVKPLIKSKDEE